MRQSINRIRAKRADEGFTLIELLVVVVIIGVLVAIAVPVYLNYRKGAADKAAQSDVRGGVSAVEQFYTSNNNTYPDTVSGTGSLSLTIGGAGAAQTITLSDQTQLGFVNNGTTYLLCASNTGGSDKWYIYNIANGGSVAAAGGTLSLATCS